MNIATDGYGLNPQGIPNVPTVGYGSGVSLQSSPWAYRGRTLSALAGESVPSDLRGIFDEAHEGVLVSQFEGAKQSAQRGKRGRRYSGRRTKHDH